MSAINQIKSKQATIALVAMVVAPVISPAATAGVIAASLWYTGASLGFAAAKEWQPQIRKFTDALRAAKDQYDCRRAMRTEASDKGHA